MAVEWDPAPPTRKQRVVAGVLLAAIAFAGCDWFFEWGVFAGYDKPVAIICFLLAAIIFVRFMPGTRET